MRFNRNVPLQRSTVDLEFLWKMRDDERRIAEFDVGLRLEGFQDRFERAQDDFRFGWPGSRVAELANCVVSYGARNKQQHGRYDRPCGRSSKAFDHRDSHLHFVQA